MVRELENLLNGSLQLLTTINSSTRKLLKPDCVGVYIKNEFLE